MTRVLNCSETAFLCIFFSTINVYYTGVTCIDLFSEQANTKLKFCCFILDISLAEEKKVEIYCFRFASWLINFAWVTNYMPPYTYPPRVETLCIGIISVLIQVMCYSQMPLSIGTQLSFWHLFDKFFDPVWNGPIRLSEQVWTRYKKHCMFVCQISKLEVDRSLQECSQERIGDK